MKCKYWSGGDARRGHTRTHPEHDGEDLHGRWYYIGDDMEEQEAAGPIFNKTRIISRSESIHCFFAKRKYCFLPVMRAHERNAREL